MKTKLFNCFLIILGIIVLNDCNVQENSPDLRGEYLGQQPPGMEGEIFAPGIMSTGLSELNSVFFPGGKEVIFSVTVGPMCWAFIFMKE